ncbi:MAG: hypothetical protein Rubg2KO_08820 [Rubricoccaceae bacterium]
MSSIPPRLGLDLLRELVRTVVSPPKRERDLGGVQVASVAVTLPVHVETKKEVTGRVSLRRGDSGQHWIGIELPFPLFGGLMSPVRRRSFTLDEVLDVVWTPSFRGGTLVLTPTEPGVFRDLPTSPHGPVTFRVARKDKSAAETLTRAVELVDLPV